MSTGTMTIYFPHKSVPLVSELKTSRHIRVILLTNERAKLTGRAITLDDST